MKYTVSVAIDCRVDVEVEAGNFEEAREEAIMSADISDKSLEFINIDAVNAEDENGNFIDY